MRDPFAGSGPTLIAAERTGRTCYAVELEPRYCDIILARWEATGQDKPGRRDTQDLLASEAGKLIPDGLAATRSYASEQPQAAEAHHLVGMLLLVAYRPVVSTVMTTNDDGSGSEETTTILRRGREMYCEEGLAALSAATRMAPGNIQYQLDYAQGLQACDQVQFSVNLLTAL